MGFFNDLVETFKEGWNKAEANRNKFGSNGDPEVELEETKQTEENEPLIEWPDFIYRGWSSIGRVDRNYFIDKVGLTWNTIITKSAIKEYIIRSEEENLEKELRNIANKDVSLIDYTFPSFDDNFSISGYHNHRWKEAGDEIMKTCPPWGATFMPYSTLKDKNYIDETFKWEDDDQFHYFTPIFDYRINGMNILETISYGNRGRFKLKAQITYGLIFHESTFYKSTPWKEIEIIRTDNYEEMFDSLQNMYEDMKEELLIEYPDRGIDNATIKLRIWG